MVNIIPQMLDPYWASSHLCGERVKLALSVHMYAYNNSRTAERIFVKFGIEVMPLEACPKSYVIIPSNRLS